MTVPEQFPAFLKDRNLPYTRQRREIAEIVFSSHRHLSAEEIMDAMKRRKISAGKATVYRTVDLLVQCGLLREHDFGEGFKRYEPLIGNPHHEHLICEQCGTVIEFIQPTIEALQQEVADAFGFEVRRHRLELYGLCRRCQRGRRKAGAR